jgi:2-iminobutanoate/2-iminopropanoate deaminase
MKTPIHSNDAPKAIGPYSQAIKVGNTVWCSGQIGLLPVSGEIISGGIDAETRQALANLRAVLAAAGATPAHVVKTTIYLISMADFAEVNAIYGETFTGVPPARATVAVAALPKGARVEIEAIAVLP